MIENNRLGDACWYKRDGKAKPGRLRMWGQAGDRDGCYPVAVIEDDETLAVTTVEVDNVSFATVPPWPREK